jgi:ribosome-associated translation inhibitor RaiA
MLKVQVRAGRMKVSAALRARVERRVGLSLGRFGERIGEVVVRLSVAGEDTRCQIDVALRPRKVQIEDRSPEVLGAVTHAADRVAGSIARLLERERQWDEYPAPPRR